MAFSLDAGAPLGAAIHVDSGLFTWPTTGVFAPSTNTVIAPDLRGFGQSAKPEGGYDKKTMAQDVHALMASLGHQRYGLAGHDIGLMVAYAYAAQYPAEVDSIADPGIHPIAPRRDELMR